MDAKIAFKVAFNHYSVVRNNDLIVQKKVPDWAYSSLSPVTPEECDGLDLNPLTVQISEDISQMKSFLDLAKVSNIFVSNYRFPYDEHTGAFNTQFSISLDDGLSMFSLTFSPENLLVAAIFTLYSNANDQIIDYTFKDDIISPYQENVLLDATIYHGLEKIYEGGLTASLCLGCLVNYSKQRLGNAYFNNKLVYSGEWMNDNYHGKGVLYSDKYKYDGVFDNNDFKKGRRSICNDQGEWIEKDRYDNGSINPSN